MVDVPVPEILEDKEYPDWLFNLLDKVSAIASFHILILLF